MDSSIRKITVVLTSGDKFLMVGILLVGLVSFYALTIHNTSGKWVVVEAGGVEQYRVPLTEDRAIEVYGPVGKTRIRIRQGKAQVMSSDCPNKICVKTGAISKAGQITVCVPNKVVVKIEGRTSENKYDVITE